ncbi:MAG TPA: PfkB family carbohydrate kinase [Edaphobacter sp.]|nr:PfkB family carbohydrate kinase [Edaphobacter sp.]
MRVLAIGEMLWDVFPQQELLGGAAFNFCANLNRLGDTARLITAVGDDERGRRAIAQMSALHIHTQFVQVVTGAPTGTAVVCYDAAGEPSFTIVRPVAYDRISITSDLVAAIKAYDPQWIYFGTLFHITERNEEFTRSILEAAPHARSFYDMNLRPDQWNIPLIRRLCAQCSILKLNEHEVRVIAAAQEMEPDISLESFAHCISDTFNIPTICITLGRQGCFVYNEGSSIRVPGLTIQTEDTVGAGDAFAAAFLHGCNSGLPILETARLANTLGAVVASRRGATPPWTLEELHAISTYSIVPR